MKTLLLKKWNVEIIYIDIFVKKLWDTTKSNRYLIEHQNIVLVEIYLNSEMLYNCEGPKENEMNKVPEMETNGIFGEILAVIKRLLVQT